MAGEVFIFGAGSGSGGGGMELTIVGGTTRPAKPPQNMIWVNTDVEITGYILSATDPEERVEGMVWIVIGDSSRIKVSSPVGDYWITVYPLSAKQLINGTLVGVETMSFQNGVWVDWWVDFLTDGIPSRGFVAAGTTCVSDTTGHYPNDTYVDLHSDKFNMNVEGPGTFIFDTNLEFDTNDCVSVTISGITQLADTSSSTATSASLVVSVLNSDGSVVAQGTYSPTAKGSTQNFSIKIPLDSAPNLCHLRISFTRNGTYRAYTTFTNIVFELG